MLTNLTNFYIKSFQFIRFLVSFHFSQDPCSNPIHMTVSWRVARGVLPELLSSSLVKLMVMSMFGIFWISKCTDEYFVLILFLPATPTPSAPSELTANSLPIYLRYSFCWVDDGWDQTYNIAINFIFIFYLK